MYFSPFFIYAGATITTGIASRIWISFRKDRVARKAMQTTLFAPVLLDAILKPNADGSDDPNILAELKSTLSHLNRQAFATEFWNLDKDLVRYYQQIPRSGRETMERSLIRLIESEEKWLQIVGAKTAASLKLVQASEPLACTLAKSESETRFIQELKTCLDTLNCLENKCDLEIGA